MFVDFLATKIFKYFIGLKNDICHALVSNNFVVTEY